MDDDIAERLREENPEQFFILVRMHLSFIIDMNTDENDSPTDKPKTFKWGFSKKFKSGENATKGMAGPAKTVETVSLTAENIKQIYQLIDILSEDANVCQEGIFRRTGSLSRQQQLRRLLSSGGNLGEEVSGYSAHDMASVLKGMLADTPEPLLLNQHYHAYCHLASTCFSEGQPIANCENRLIGALRLLLLLLPSVARQLANRLLVLLHRVASFEASNRMSPGALATMFTPHVMCPRRLSPEALHADSQSLSPVLSFMIRRAPVLFTTPPQLATDIAAYLAKKEHRRLLSPNGEDLNESVSERTAASTVFTFVDRRMSGVTGNDAAGGATTDAALAQLYAHIQSLPESHNKRRLIKQFNRENGHGTPLQMQRAQKHKSLGESLKKHIFNKSLMNRSGKKPVNLNEQRFGLQPMIESPSIFKNNFKSSAVKLGVSESPKQPKSDLCNSSVKSTEQMNSEVSVAAEMTDQAGGQEKDLNVNENVEEDDILSDSNDDHLDEASFSCDEGNTLERVERLTPKYTSEPNLSFLPSNHEVTPKFTKNKSSKLFKTKSLLPSHMASRKDTKKHDIQKLQNRSSADEKISKDSSDHSLNFKSCVKCTTDSFSEADVSGKDYKPVSRNGDEVASPKSDSNTPRLCRKDSVKYLRNKRINSRGSSASLKDAPNLILKEESSFPKDSDVITEIDSMTPEKCAMSAKSNYLTSTPAIGNIMMNQERIYEGCSTPMFVSGHIMRRGSMSPITKSTQKMSKAMQESIMTPRSRKPVIINCDPPTNTLPCHMSLHNSISSESSNSDTVYDSTPSSMKNDSDFVSTDESRPSSACYIKYKHMDETRENTSKDKSCSSMDNFTSISDSALSERRMRILQERNYQKLLETKNPGCQAYSINQSKVKLLEDKLFEESDSHSTPNTSLKSINNVSLTDPFRQYLQCRSVFTGSPVDLSFTSSPEDYSDGRIDNIENLSEGKMTESLLYCMNGNIPADLTINSNFNCSDKEMLIKKDESFISHFNGASIIKSQTGVENHDDASNGNLDISMKIFKMTHRGDVVNKLGNFSEATDKENVGPGNKRPAQSACNNTVDQDATEVKKVNMTNDNIKKTKEIDKNALIHNADPDYWDYSRYGPLWETNL